jgi:phosphoribosylformylglycinamidine synthase
MVTMKAKVFVTLKNGVLDPQGKAIEQSIGNMGFDGVSNVKQGKFIELDIAEENAKKATEKLEKICRELLANTVIENYKIEVQ